MNSSDQPCYCAANSTQNTTSYSVAHGWVSQPNNRGTLDIIWGCVSTLFVCVFVMLHLNVRGPTDGFWSDFARRSKWFALSLFAPELIMLIASGQWASAKNSVAEMHGAGYSEWSLIHAYYADSGGFVLYSDDFPAFPITAKQIHSLVAEHQIDIPTITKEEIWDKSKADGFAKIVAAGQTAWFIIQVLARAIQSLTITPIELSTVAILSCTGTSFYFWFYKPLNVEIPTIINAKSTMHNILIDGGDKAKKPYIYTPLDFIEPMAAFSSQPPLCNLRNPQLAPLTRIPDDKDPPVPNLQHYVLIAVPIAAFNACHCCAWYFHFPTAIELWLWRVASIVMALLLMLLGMSEVAASIVARRSSRATTFLGNLGGYKQRWPVNLLFFVPVIIYIIVRLWIIGLVFSSLRALPQYAFVDINWTGFLPHI